MTELTVEPVDPHDPAAFDAFYDAYLAAERAAGPGVASPWMREEVRVTLQERATRRSTGGYVGRVGAGVVAAGFLSVPLLDNRESADLSVHVPPAVRRRGHGSGMLAALEREAGARGRTVLHAEATWPYDAGPDGATSPGPAFARARGFALGLGNVKRVRTLPVPGGLLDELEREAAPHRAAYRLRSWSGPVPDDLLDGWARLTATLMTEAPTGEMQRETEVVDPAVIREGEATIARQGRTKYNTVALDTDGDVVAYTDVATTVHEPGRAYQWGTLVRRDARGHRLGLAVKVANLRLLQRERPDLHELTTYNAEVNAHMVAVNERLGFEPVARLGEFEKIVRT